MTPDTDSVNRGSAETCIPTLSTAGSLRALLLAQPDDHELADKLLDALQDEGRSIRGARMMVKHTQKRGTWDRMVAKAVKELKCKCDIGEALRLECWRRSGLILSRSDFWVVPSATEPRQIPNPLSLRARIYDRQLRDPLRGVRVPILEQRQQALVTTLVGAAWAVGFAEGYRL